LVAYKSQLFGKDFLEDQYFCISSVSVEASEEVELRLDFELDCLKEFFPDIFSGKKWDRLNKFGPVFENKGGMRIYFSSEGSKAKDMKIYSDELSRDNPTCL